jgi:hypothetical protein
MFSARYRIRANKVRILSANRQRSRLQAHLATKTPVKHLANLLLSQLKMHRLSTPRF